jgi:hypothetical protein
VSHTHPENKHAGTRNPSGICLHPREHLGRGNSSKVKKFFFGKNQKMQQKRLLG